MGNDYEHYEILDDDGYLQRMLTAEEEMELHANKFLQNGKTPMSMAPMELLEIFSKMCMAGLNKGYTRDSWLTDVSIYSHLESLKRHIRDYERGINIDPDGFHNLEAILWRASAACLVHHFRGAKPGDQWVKAALEKGK